MSDKSCDCRKFSLGNTGFGCVNNADVLNNLMFDMLIDSTGVKKERLLADMKSLATVNTFINAADARDRLYPVTDIEDVENIREDPIFKEYNSGKKGFVRDGFKNYQGFIPNAPRELVDQLNENRCQNFGAWGLDDSNQLGYKKGTDNTKGQPINILSSSFFAKYIEATYTDEPGIFVAFQWSKNVKDSEIGVIPASELDYTADDLEGLIDGQATFTGESTSGVTATITETAYGGTIEGLLLADFAAEEISPVPGLVVITAVTETSAGVYDIEYVAVSADVIRITITKTGFDFSSVSDGTNDITTP